MLRTRIPHYEPITLFLGANQPRRRKEREERVEKEEFLGFIYNCCRFRDKRKLLADVPAAAVVKQ
jgi:hypothetical protein